MRRDGRPVQGSLLALADQPHIPATLIRRIIDKARALPDAVVVPSYMRRRGHPVYLPQRFFSRLLSLESGRSLRDLLEEVSEEIVYEVVESDCVRRDMDLPAEYESLRAEFEWTE